MDDHTFDRELAARYASELHHDLSEGSASSGGWTEGLLRLLGAAIRQHDELAALLAQREEAQDTPLEASIEHGALVIRIGIHRLAGAAAGSEWANQWNSQADNYIRDFAIVDAQQFAKDVQSAMLSEAEDGSSPLTRFLDQVSESAVEDGSIALHYEGVAIAFGETHALETWAAPPESR